MIPEIRQYESYYGVLHMSDKFQPDLPMSTKEKWIRFIIILIVIPPMLYWIMRYIAPYGL